MDKQPLIQGQGTPGYPPPYATAPQQPAQPPPAYGYNPPPQQTTVVVAQPTAVVYQRHYGSGDHFLILSIIMSFVCFFFGSWLALICTIPAIFVAISAQDAESRGDTITVERNRRTALYLNIGAMVTGVVSWIALIIWIVVQFAAIASYNDKNYN